MKVSIESLLEPISADNPCGEDIGYDPQFLELETMLLGKQETQFNAAEEPDWKVVVDRCLELFRRSKDLRVALRLTLGLLRTSGLAGFRDGLSLLKGMIEHYWEHLYPRLDPDDNNDPLERVNVLASLATPMGTYGDPLQFISRVRLAPLSESSQLGRICMMDVERSVSGAPTAEGTIITASQIGAAFRSTPPAALKNTFEAIVGAEAIVRELDDLLTKAVGTSNSVTFDPLAKCLKDLQKALAPYAVQGKTENVEASPDVSASDSDTSSDTSAGAAITGSVRSRQDVIRVLEQICDFYRRTEPSSPVPLLLQRARRLVDMDFVQLLTELTPESLNQIKLIAGIRADSTEGESEG